MMRINNAGETLNQVQGKLFKFRSNKRKIKGQALVEMALILPVLTLIIFGGIQIGIILNTYLAVSHVAREGARYAAINPDSDEQIKSHIQEICPASIRYADMSITITATSRTTGNPITVGIKYDIENKLFFPTNFFGAELPSSLPEIKATMMIE